MDSLRWEHERTVAYVNARIGHAPAALTAHDARVRDTPIIDFINEVQRRTAGAQLSATAAFQLDAELPAGDITDRADRGAVPVRQHAQGHPHHRRAAPCLPREIGRVLRGWPAPAGGTVTNFAVPGYNFDIVSGVDYALDISRPVGSASPCCATRAPTSPTTRPSRSP
jgi:2',3'-cyclic-nucleotide 2'-phosphodiesterase (5'-nucleotidase family)